MSRLSKKKILMWILFLFWILLIFYMSNQSARISYKQSGFVKGIIKTLGIDIESKVSRLTSSEVRKTAHIIVYCIFAVITYKLVKCYAVKKNNIAAYSGGNRVNKTSKKKIVRWIIFLCWLAFIFYMSNQPAVISDEQSGFVIDFIKAIGIDIESKLGELTNFVVRKTAHVSEYFILACIAYNLVRCYTEKKNHARIYCIIIVFLYACTDEFHQLFVPGRSGMFRDVLIDTSGAVIAAIVLYILSRIKTKKQ